MGDALDQRPCQETKSMDVRKSTFLLEHLLEMLSFLSRNQLERISITSKLLNNLLRQCFAVKPYRYQHSELVIDPKENGKHLRLITTMMDDSGKESVHYLHINKSNDVVFDWKQQIRCYSVEESLS
ncbi:hypothetical protein Ddc_12213 [Ditylenchus destructor]|nr:hypothetical protein Ddc_12213 [Ditylenchus destructor]